ncbi:MAG: hypothetical protein JXR77_16590 [Lentisphaeria bacterium]|nr:hypothetical protein [Lentisphaeria bacterium]
MALELIYTSADRGLRPGTRGFCTVAYTTGMPPQMIQLLEGLSAYNALFPVHHERAADNPVSISHYRPTMAGRNASILSRVGPAPAEHTQRSNKIAHHVVLRAGECPEAGPAWVAAQEGFFRERWDGPPQHIAAAKAVPEGSSEGTYAEHWEVLTGDAGWAGVLAWHFLSRSASPAYLLFEPGMGLLPLVAEALALIPPSRRWEVTFNTYFTCLPAGATCVWRCCVPDLELVRDVRRNPRALVIDLTAPLPAPEDSELVRCAREGTPVPPIPRKSVYGKDCHGASFLPLANRVKARLRMKPQPPPGPGA